MFSIAEMENAMLSFSIARLSLGLCLGISPFSSGALTHPVQIPATVLPKASKAVDRSFGGFAFEQSLLYNYSFGAQGKPPEFSQNLVEAVIRRTGGTPLRVGDTMRGRKTQQTIPRLSMGNRQKSGVTG
jgi:hypothetical protein